MHFCFCLSSLKLLFKFLKISCTDSGSGKGSGYNSIVPDAAGAETHILSKVLGDKIGTYVEQYVEAMEKVIIS